jgi:hypothetical protein
MFWLKVFQSLCVLSESAAQLFDGMGSFDILFQEIRESRCESTFELGAAAIAGAAFFPAARPAAAKDFEYRHEDLTSSMLQGGFERSLLPRWTIRRLLAGSKRAPRRTPSQQFRAVHRHRVSENVANMTYRRMMIGI